MNRRSEFKEKASILMIALWSLFILASFAVVLGFQVRQRMVLVKRLESRSKLSLIADAAIPLGIAEIKKFAKAEYMGLKDSWSNNPSFKDIPLAGGTCSFIRPAFEPAAAGQGIQYGMVDEESKININKADMKLLTALIRVVLGVEDTEAQSLAASLIDWRDEDSTLSIPLGSAEDSYYRNERNPYEAKDALFESLDEVRLVKGFNANVFEKIQDYITIYGSGKININTAGRNVLYATGMADMAVDRLLAVRSGKDEIAGTDDDNVFGSIADVAPALTKDGGFTPTQLADMNNLINAYTAVVSTAFTVNSAGKSPGDIYESRVSCVIDRSGRILSYRRN